MSFWFGGVFFCVLLIFFAVLCLPIVFCPVLLFFLVVGSFFGWYIHPIVVLCFCFGLDDIDELVLRKPYATVMALQSRFVDELRPK